VFVILLVTFLSVAAPYVPIVHVTYVCPIMQPFWSSITVVC